MGMKILSRGSGSGSGSGNGIATNRCANDGWKFYHRNNATTTAIVVAIVAMPVKIITSMTKISYGR